MKHIKNKKYAFTMLELVFVIVVAGILTAAIVPRFDRNNLQEAADQLISHIRYTQHLAMVDDKFLADRNLSRFSSLLKSKKELLYWYKGRWQIYFFNVSGETPSYSFASYTVFSDSPSGSQTHLDQYDGNPNQSTTYKEVAKNPLDSNRYLIGTTHASFTVGSDHITKSLNLYSKYGINLVKFMKGCNLAHRIAFDYIGRPLQGDLKTSNKPYQIGRVITSQCQIALCKTNPCSEDNITIAIEPETGYTHIL